MTTQVSHIVEQAPLTAFGQQSLAPVFAAFALLLLQEARHRKLNHLAFVARDGLFLGQVTATLIHALDWPEPPRLTDVHLSRLSTSLAGRERLDESAFAEAQGVKGGDFTLGALLRYYGLGDESQARETQPPHLTPHLAAAGLKKETPLNCFADVAPLLQVPEFQNHVQAVRQHKLARLKRYLTEQGLFGATQSALVDIGWRGTIAATLDRAFAHDPDYRPQPWFYLGYWHELGCQPLVPGRSAASIHGLLADQRRSKGLGEGAAYYLSLLLEAVCRPPQGPTDGYALQGERVLPHITAYQPTALEAAAQPHSAAIRDGILAGVADWGHAWRQACPDAVALRRQSQRRLRQLAFFPSAEVIALAQHLCHTEGHHATWATPLLPATPPRPWRQPKAWLAGLSAPWRSGYVAASGGPLLAALFYGLETTLQALPGGVRESLRRLALNLSGKGT